MASLAGNILSLRRVFGRRFLTAVATSSQFYVFRFSDIDAQNRAVMAQRHWRGFAQVASKAVTGDEREHCNVGTIGHIDHGKTTLTAAITKVMAEEGMARVMKYDDIDRAPEEKARGITINACHVSYNTDKRHYAHTDCPGHIDYIKNMICGTSQMDGAILVISATDGTMPQTTEHLMVAKQIGLKNIIVYINKADLVDKEMLELVELEAREVLDQFGFDGNGAEVIYGSALCALEDREPQLGRNSILKLMAALDKNIVIPRRDTSGPFMLPVETAVTVPGRGTVAVGTLQQGVMKRGSEVDLIGFGNNIKTTVTDIEVFNKGVSTARAGENLGALLRNVKRDFVQRGMFVCEPNSLQQYEAFEAQLYICTKAEGGRSKPVMPKYNGMLFLDTWSIACCLLLPEDKPMAMPGDACIATMLLRKPMVLREGQRFMVREDKQTAMTGVISKLLPDFTMKISGFNELKQKTAATEGKKKKGKK